MWPSIDVFNPWDVDMLATYLVRSRSCPIALTITARNEDSPMTEDPASAISSLIRPHIHRCHKISFDLDEDLNVLLESMSGTL
jgi:hypothetical protein